MREDFRRDLRLFSLGGVCGLVAGILLMGIVVWTFGPRFATDPARAQVDERRETEPWTDGMGPVDAPRPRATDSPTGTTGAPAPVMEAAGDVEAMRELKDRDLEVPVKDIRPDQLTYSFHDTRSGNRKHEALDILAPRNTPVTATEDGRIVKLFQSKAGGLAIYQFDPSERYCYYYAHLEGYASGLKEGDNVRQGQVIGYVGTTGNAPRDTPHLHFAIFRLTPEKRWWEGTPLDPFEALR